jgi:hypothetical protein
LYASTKKKGVKDHLVGQKRRDAAREAIGDILGIDPSALAAAGEIRSGALKDWVAARKASAGGPKANGDTASSIADRITEKVEELKDFERGELSDAFSALTFAKASGASTPQSIEASRKAHEAATEKRRELNNQLRTLHRQLGAAIGQKAALGTTDLTGLGDLLKNIGGSGGIPQAYDSHYHFMDESVKTLCGKFPDLRVPAGTDLDDFGEQRLAGFLSSIIEQAGLTKSELDLASEGLATSIPR